MEMAETVEVKGRGVVKGVAEGEALVLWGSQDTLEISVMGGSAEEVMGMERGDGVKVVWDGAKREK